MGFRLVRGLPALAAGMLCALSSVSAAAQPLTTTFAWTADGYSTAPTCTTAPCAATALTPRTGGAAFTVYGRSWSGLHVGPQSAVHLGVPNGGYVAGVKNDYTLGGVTSGYAWMAFVWLDADLGPTALPQTILWQEGPDAGRYKPGVTLYVQAGNQVVGMIGRNGVWAADKVLVTRNRLGAGAWHHVALVWDGSMLRLLLDGIEEAATPCTFAPDGSSSTDSLDKVGVGAFYNGGRLENNYVLSGAVDEVKLVQFPIGTYDPSNSFVLREHGLRFRKALLDDMAAAGLIAPGTADYDRFREATLESTGRIRALISSFFTVESQNPAIPLDPISTWSAGVMNYVYPDAPAIASEGNSMYMRIRNGAATGYCGAAATLLFAAYKAFGFSTRLFDVVDGADFNYAGSHVTTDVYLPSLGRYVLQDATYNVSGVAGTGTLDVFDMIGRSRAASLPPLTDDGYVVAGPVHAWRYQTNVFYSFFAGGVVSATPSWQY
jgi:hypothetical protein